MNEKKTVDWICDDTKQIRRICKSLNEIEKCNCDSNEFVRQNYHETRIKCQENVRRQKLKTPRTEKKFERIKKKQNNTQIHGLKRQFDTEWEKHWKTVAIFSFFIYDIRWYWIFLCWTIINLRRSICCLVAFFFGRIHTYTFASITHIPTAKNWQNQQRLAHFKLFTH